MVLVDPCCKHLVGDGALGGHKEAAVLTSLQPHPRVGVDEGQGPTDVPGLEPGDVLNLAAEVVPGGFAGARVSVHHAADHEAAGGERPVLGADDLARGVGKEFYPTLLGDFTLQALEQGLADVDEAGDARVHAFRIPKIRLFFEE